MKIKKQKQFLLKKYTLISNLLNASMCVHFLRNIETSLQSFLTKKNLLSVVCCPLTFIIFARIKK